MSEMFFYLNTLKNLTRNLEATLYLYDFPPPCVGYGTARGTEAGRGFISNDGVFAKQKAKLQWFQMR